MEETRKTFEKEQRVKVLIGRHQGKIGKVQQLYREDGRIAAGFVKVCVIQGYVSAYLGKGSRSYWFAPEQIEAWPPVEEKGGYES
jgi:hypothetical protein